MQLIKTFEFDSAHFLPDYNGKCENLHGHTYGLTVKLEGTPAADGLIMDFTILKQIVKDEVIEVLDHTCLNDLIKNPSAENIAIWIWKALDEKLTRPNCKLAEIEVWETRTSGVVYKGK